MKRLILCAGAGSVMLSAGGCALVAVGAVAAAAAVGTSVYMNGKLESNEQATLEESYEATLAAMEAMEFDIKKHDKDALEARVLSERASGETVTVRLFGEEDGTRIAIRVGALGDEQVSMRLLEEIRSRLPASSLAAGGKSNNEHAESRGESDLQDDAQSEEAMEEGEIASAEESDSEL